MVQLTMQLPDELAARIKPIHYWLPTILELSIDGFRSLATETASEIIQFLSTNPTQKEVIDFHVSKKAQSRLQRLLKLNEAGYLSESEQTELNELQRIEHTMIMLKSQLIKNIQQEK